MSLTGKCQQLGLLFSIMLALLVPITADAAFISGSTGADGAFEPTASVAVQIPESGVLM